MEGTLPLPANVAHPFVIVAGGEPGKTLGLLAAHGPRADAVLVDGRIGAKLQVSNPLPFPVELPVDVIAGDRLDETAETRTCALAEMPYGWLPLDLGPQTRERFAARIASAHTVLWTGTMGAVEWPRFAEGTLAIAHAVAQSGAFAVAVGAETRRLLDEQRAGTAG